VRRLASAGLALALLLAACTTAARTHGARSGRSAPPPSASGSPSASPAAEATDAPDPFGTTAVRSRFAGRIIQPLPERLQREMRGETWTAGCPAPLLDLALLRFNYWGFDGDLKRGPMVVNRSVASDVLGVFEALFEARFPIRHVALAKRFRPNADPDSRGSVTASFNCRPVVTADGPGDTFSQHSYGLAVDINSLQNPYVREDGYVRNRSAEPYVDRSQDLPGMIHPGDVVVRAFTAIGWTWGGAWSGDKDYMHFSLTGR
jgi:hypothetical protein